MHPSTNYKVNLRLIVEDWTFFVGLCPLLSHCCIGRFYAIRRLLSDILGLVSEMSVVQCKQYFIKTSCLQTIYM